jgi:hypothetical protein
MTASGASAAGGTKGVTGPTGPTGAQGVTGATGKEGPEGKAGANGVNGNNGINGTDGSNGVTGATGATGPTGPAGVNGANGSNGTTGPTGTGSPEFPKELQSKGTEAGTWAVKIQAPTGSKQSKAEGVISFAPKLKVGEKVTSVYKFEKEKFPTTACPGSPEKPAAAEGTLCIFTGGGFGSQESEQKEAKFVGFANPSGETCEPPGTCKADEIGTFVLFETNQFENVEGGGPPLASEAFLNALGSWAVTSK